MTVVGVKPEDPTSWIRPSQKNDEGNWVSPPIDWENTDHIFLVTDQGQRYLIPASALHGSTTTLDEVAQYALPKS